MCIEWDFAPRDPAGREIRLLRKLFQVLLIIFLSTVNLWSKRPGRKGNPPLRDIDFNLDIIFFSYSYVGSKGISVHRKNWSEIP